jgi:hypothetical protein
MSWRSKARDGAGHPRALVLLLEQHGPATAPGSCWRSSNGAGARGAEQAGRKVLDYLREGNEPATPEELGAVRNDWQGSEDDSGGKP